jgi:hypothetical protein
MRFFTLGLLFFCALIPQAYSRNANISIAPGGIGIHALRPSPRETIELMPRKIDRNGHFVMTPGFLLNYRYKNEQMGFMIIQDSFGNAAAGAAWGMHFVGARNFRYGFVAGIYARESVEKCHALSNGRTTCITHSNDIPLKFKVGKAEDKVDIAPIVAGTLNYFIPLTKNFQIDIGFMSAFYISLLSVGIRFPI